MAMYEGNWKCSRCGGAITQLPFQPRSEAGLTCRTCYANSQAPQQSAAPAPTPLTDASNIPDYDPSQIATEPEPAANAFVGMETTTLGNHQSGPTGNWTCSVCSGTITSLPFTPRNTDNLKCLDCFKASKN